MNSDRPAAEIRDAVLSVLSATERSLGVEEIRNGIQPPPELRDVRVALRDLAQDGELRNDGQGRWSAVASIPATPKTPSGSADSPTSDNFRRELIALKKKARSEGLNCLEISAGELHRIVGGYPGHDHRMPVCCMVMRQEMRGGDEVLDEPPKGNGASLTIAYRLHGF